MRTILFLCSGNYYRSRFAEYYFNDRARRIGLDWLAVSRGLATECGINNIGPISPLTLGAMARHGISAPKSLRYPRAVSNDDLLIADLIIAVREKEHRPLMHKYFPSWEEHVCYWDIQDLDGVSFDEALPMLASEIDHLTSDLGAMTHTTLYHSERFATIDCQVDAEQTWQPLQRSAV